MKKLNLGCGKNIKKDYVNLDFIKMPGVNIIHNLNKFPWPFKDNEFEEIISSHVLEHLEDLEKTMNEIKRICKNKAKIKFVVPHFSCGDSYRDPTHKRLFSYFTFDYFTENSFYKNSKFKILNRKFNFFGERTSTGMGEKKYKLLSPFNELLSSIVNISPKIYGRFFCWILPTYEIHIELGVIK